jgi:hypothetical protein
MLPITFKSRRLSAESSVGVVRATRAGGGLRRRPRLGRIERRRPRQHVPSAQSRGGEELLVLALALASVVREADRARGAVGWRY